MSLPVMNISNPHRSFKNDKYGGTWNMWYRGGHRFHIIEYPDHLRLLWDYASDPDDRWFGDATTIIDMDNPTEDFIMAAFRMFEGAE